MKIMKTVINLIVFTLATCAISAKIPLRPVHPAFAKWNTKIVGGKEVVPHSVPHQVGLFLDGSFCGGSLISNRFVLTAAHCGEISVEPQVVLGAHKIREAETTQVIINGKKPVIHEDWNANTLENDISVIELPTAVTVNENINTINLTSADSPDFSGAEATVTGWGLVSDSATTISEVLRTVTSTILTNDDCRQQFGHNIPIRDSIICLDGTEGRGSCNGDSGGALSIEGIQVGVVSFGIALGCQVGYPSAFTRVSYYRDWIDSKVKN